MSAALPQRWSRFHPLSLVARYMGAGAGYLFVLAQRIVFHPSHPAQKVHGALAWFGGHAWDLVIVVVPPTLAVVSWVVTRWRISGGELQVEKGVLRRQSIRVPLARIQAIEIFRPPTARICGLSGLRVVVAGTGRDHHLLAYLSAREAAAVRARLLALAHGRGEHLAEPPERVIAAVDNARLAASIFLRPVGLVPVLIVLSWAVTGVLAPRAVAAGLIGSTGAIAFFWGVHALRYGLSTASLVVAEAPDGIRLRQGIVTTKAETIPRGRIQALRLTQPLLFRPFGWCRLEIDVAQQKGKHSRDLIPVLPRHQAACLVGQVLPGAGSTAPEGAKPPRRAAWRAPLSFHYLGAWHDEAYSVASVGRICRKVIIVPLAKAQSIRWSEGPLSRALQLGSVQVDTVGRGWKARARWRDKAEAAQLVGELACLAAQARSRARPVIGDAPLSVS